MAFQVAVVGSLNIDTVIEVPRLPGRGDTVVGERARTGFGGKGANQAAAAGTFLGVWGAVGQIGCVGSDPAGAEMLADLRRRSVDVSGIRVVDGPSGHATVAVDPDGNNLILVQPNANAAVNPLDVTVDAVAGARILLLQLEIPAATAAAAARHARGLVVLNPAPAAGAAAVLPDADVLVPNRTELAELTGQPPADDLDGVVDQIGLLQADADVVVTLGADGALVMERSGRVLQVSAARTEVLDTTGAGDCFCGVLAALLAEGSALIDAVRAAVLAAGLSVGARGARGFLPHRSDLAP